MEHPIHMSWTFEKCLLNTEAIVNHKSVNNKFPPTVKTAPFTYQGCTDKTWTIITINSEDYFCIKPCL